MSPQIPIALQIEGPPTDSGETSEEGESETATTNGLKVVYIADTDLILPEFF